MRGVQKVCGPTMKEQIHLKSVFLVDVLIHFLLAVFFIIIMESIMHYLHLLPDL